MPSGAFAGGPVCAGRPRGVCSDARFFVDHNAIDLESEAGSAPDTFPVAQGGRFDVTICGRSM